MSTYKLCYFNARGGGELSRWLFAEAEQKYEDCRWERADWPDYKPNSPTGQAPWLEVDGRKIAQSSAMNRFLAKRFGKYGKDEFEEAQIDMISGCIVDLFNLFIPILMEEDADRKVVMKKKVQEEKAPEALARLEKLLKTNNDGDGYFVGNDATLADFQVATSTDILDMVGMTSLMDDVPKLKALKERVLARPKIAAWIKDRPQTQH